MKLIKWMGSKKIAYALILLLIIYCLLGVSRGIESKQYDSTFFYKAPMQILLVALILNTVACIFIQSIRRRRFFRRLQGRAKPVNWKIQEVIEEPGEELLKKRGYRKIGPVVWAKRSYALVFILLFHLSFVLIGLGGLWSSLSRMESLVPITDGEQFRLTLEAYSLLEIKGNGRLKTEDWIIKLNNIRVEYPQRGWPLDVQADLELWDADGLALNDRVKKIPPLSYKGHQFNVWDFSYAPFITIRRDGHELIASYASLATHTEEDRVVIKDNISLPDNEVLQLEFLPRGADEQWGSPEKHMYPIDPKLRITLLTTGQNIVLAQGQQAKLGIYEIGFGDYRYTVLIKVIKDQGTDLIFIAFWLGIISLTGHFFFPARFASLSADVDRAIIHHFTGASFSGWRSRIDEY